MCLCPSCGKKKKRTKRFEGEEEETEKAGEKEREEKRKRKREAEKWGEDREGDDVSYCSCALVEEEGTAQPLFHLLSLSCKMILFFLIN